MKNRNLLFVSCLALSGAIVACGKTTTVSISADTSIKTSEFAIAELKAALERNNLKYVESKGDYVIKLNEVKPELGEQSYQVNVEGNTISIDGGDSAGSLYGALQLAEDINLLNGISGVKSSEGSPYLKYRGQRCRVVMDLRTPCYINNSENAWANIENSWSKDYWKGYFETLARQRYNLVNFATVNSLASVIKVPGFENCALNNVLAYTGEYDDGYYGNCTNMYQEHHMNEGNYRVVNTMTIDEKTKFWKEVIDMAHTYGIYVQWSTMNIYTFAENGHYGITDRRDNEITKEYFRKGYETLIKTFDIDMFGTGASENMDYPADTYLETEQWIRDVYGEAVKNAMENDPRKDRFIFNYQSTLDEATEALWKDYPITRGASPRYSDTHMYALDNPINNEANFEKLEALNMPSSYKYLFNTRNEDAYHFTYGNPSFCKEFMKNLKKERTRGFFFGSDGYYMGKEYSFKDESLNGQYYYARHWINYMMMGRFAYDPTISLEKIDDLIYDHFEGVKKDSITAAWNAMKKASGMLIEVQKQFTLGGTDAAWYPGNCQSHPTMFGYIDVKRLINSDNLFPGVTDKYSFASYAKAFAANSVDSKLDTPFDTANKLRTIAKETLDEVKEYKSSNSGNVELDNIVADQETVAYLADYYASKFDGGMNLRLFNDTLDDNYKNTAIKNQQDALEKWKKYSDSFLARFKVERLPRVGVVDPSAFVAGVEKDIKTVTNWSPREYK